VVQTTHGKVRGTLLKGVYEDLFYAFDGIPYAAPPLENMRFKEPLDIEPWEEIRDCSKPLSKCIQVSSQTKLVEGSEDCLYLNISVKTVSYVSKIRIHFYIIHKLRAIQCACVAKLSVGFFRIRQIMKVYLFSALHNTLSSQKLTSERLYVEVAIVLQLKFVPLSMPKLKFHDHMFEQAGVALF